MAEEVSAIDRNLVARDKNGQIETVRCTAVDAMLLNEFLKEQRKVQESKTRVVQQQKEIDALTTGFTKVRAQRGQ